jgi:hypothetical protein
MLTTFTAAARGARLISVCILERNTGVSGGCQRLQMSRPPNEYFCPQIVRVLNIQ